MTSPITEEAPQRRERAQSLVELAISLTVIMLLLAGAVSFGMALFSYVAIRDAAGEGALYGSIKPYHDSDADGTYDAGEPVNSSGTDGICARVRAASNSPVDMTSFDCTTDGGAHTGNNIDVIAIGSPCEGNTGSTANAVQVTVEYFQPVFMPLIGAIIGQQIHLQARVTNTILTPSCP